MRNDTVSREVLRHKEFEGCVQLKRIRDWFICTFPVFPVFLPSNSLAPSLARVVSIESESAYNPEELMPEAIKVMRSKISSIRAAAEALLQDSQDLSGGGTDGPDADGDVEMDGAKTMSSTLG